MFWCFVSHSLKNRSFCFFFRRQAIEALVTLSTRDDAPDPRDGVEVTSRLRTWRVVVTIVTTVGRNTANMIHFSFNEMPLSLMMRHGREPSKSFSPMTQYSTYMVYWAVDFWTFQTQPLISCIVTGCVALTECLELTEWDWPLTGFDRIWLSGLFRNKTVIVEWEKRQRKRWQRFKRGPMFQCF